MQDESSTIETVRIYTHGDVSIVAGDKFLNKRFIVSSTALELACEPWKAMLQHHNRLGSGSQTLRELNFEGDDSDALQLLLHIAHLHFERVPKKLGYKQLLSLAVLTNKYLATRLIQPWIQRWVTQLHYLMNKPGYEEFVWIAWEFGFHEDFDSLATHMTLEAISNNESGCIINGSEATLLCMPPGLPESILDVRAITVDRLLAVPYGYIDRIIEPQGGGNCDKDNRRGCDALSLGSLAIALARYDLWPTRKTSSDIHMSISQLAERLRDITVHDYPHNGYYGRYHEAYRCNISQKMKFDIEKILSEIPSSVTKEHRAYMKAQKTLLNLSENSELATKCSNAAKRPLTTC